MRHELRPNFTSSADDMLKGAFCRLFSPRLVLTHNLEKVPAAVTVTLSSTLTFNDSSCLIDICSL